MEPIFARFFFFRQWVTIVRWTVLNYVCYINITTRHFYTLEHLREKLASRANKRYSGLVFLFTWSFTYKDYFWFWISITKDCSRGAVTKLTYKNLASKDLYLGDSFSHYILVVQNIKSAYFFGPRISQQRLGQTSKINTFYIFIRYLKQRKW